MVSQHYISEEDNMIFMHSTVNPETEAKILANEVSACEKYIVIIRMEKLLLYQTCNRSFFKKLDMMSQPRTCQEMTEQK